MKVLFISPNTERLFMPTLPLGLALVAAATRRAGHETRFLDLLAATDALNEVSQAIADFQPEVIALSVRNVDDQTMLDTKFLLGPVRDVVDVCRASCQAKIVVGGAGYSIFPEAALRYLGADLGVCGEGEKVFPILLERLQQGHALTEILGVHLPGGRSLARQWFAEDLNRLPWPGEELWRSADPGDAKLWVPVQTRRGCPLDCSYCSTPAIEGRRPRFRSPELVTRHIGDLTDAGFRQFYFVDNTFNLPSSYALRLCRCLAALPLKIQWRAIVYPHSVSEELVQAMAEAGCVEVSLGFESGCPQVLQAMNKRFGPAEVREISERLAAHGIRRMGFLLLGGPGKTKESVDESLAFAWSLNLEMLKVSVGIRLYPHTPLARLAVEEGMVSPEDDLLMPRFYIRPGLEDYIRQAQGEI